MIQSIFTCEIQIIFYFCWIYISGLSYIPGLSYIDHSNLSKFSGTHFLFSCSLRPKCVMLLKLYSQVHNINADHVTPEFGYEMS